jgi:hypothetical protein
MIKPSAYGHTEVPAERSQMAIRKLLQRYGCTAVAMAEDFGKGELQLRFAHLLDGSDRGIVVRMVVQFPKVPVQYSRYRSRENAEEAARDHACRQAWRVIFYSIKSRLEAVTFGVETFEEAFLAHVEVVTEGGDRITFGEWALPRMRAGRLALNAKEE